MIEQVQNVARTTIVQDAWRRGHAVQLHGWIYGLKDGLITDLGIQISIQIIEYPRSEIRNR